MKIFDENINAAAYTIVINTSNQKPVAWVILLSSNYIFSRKNVKSFLIIILLHEISHILGFSNGLYDYYQTTDILIKTKTINGIQRTLFSGSNVIKHANRHFECDDIEGVELENKGGECSARSHWKSRIMLSDYMISINY